MTNPATATFKAFAAIAGCKPPYVTALRKAGRLVLTDDGRAVKVAESLARIAATRDPAMQAVADRHAAARETKSERQEMSADGEHGTRSPQSGADKIGNSYQAARAVKERYHAMAAKRDYEISIGKLLDAEDVRSVVASTITVLRTNLETMPDTIAPLVSAENDESKIRAILAEAVEHALAELARTFSDIAKESIHQ